MKNIGFIIVILILLALGIVFLFNLIQENRVARNIQDFDECVAMGFPVMESYPEQCVAGDRNFVRYIGNELEKVDSIILDNPRPNQKIQSPLEFRGRARGTWLFEADFPVRLFDSNGNEISVAIATAVLKEGETWMTEEFVEFSGTIEFTQPTTNKGTLIFEKDNASGLPELDDYLTMPVYFE